MLRSVIGPLFVLLTLLALIGPAEQASAGNIVTIDNGVLKVSYFSDSGEFSARSDQHVFLPHGRLTDTPEGTSATRVNISDSMGTGTAIRVGTATRITELRLYDNVRFLCIGTTLLNPTEQALTIPDDTPVRFSLDCGAIENLRILGCDGLSDAAKDRISYAFLAAASKDNTGTVCGWITQNRGSGIVASATTENLLAIEPRSEYGKLLIPASGKAQGEILVVGYFENTTTGLEAYADAIASANNIKLKPVPSGYCTWYSSPNGGASDEKHMAEMTQFCEKELKPFGFEVLQIDDKWQISGRDFTDHKPDGPYPSGMKPTAERIKAAGMIPGIWIIPFGWDHKRPIFADHQDWFVHREDGSVYSVHWAGDCLDMTHPQAKQFLRETLERITEQWGYTYLKIDGLWTGLAAKILYPEPTYRPDGLGDAVFHDPNKTNIEAYRDGLRLLRDTVGPDVYVLGCNIAQNMRTLGASFGVVDGMRVGSDTGAKWGSILRGATMGSRLYFFHGRAWHNDPDCLMLRSPLTLDQARTWGSWIGLSGQLNLVSEWLPGLPPERLDVLKRSMPNHGLCARPLDLFDNDPAEIWQLTSGEGRRQQNIIGLFNWNDKQPLDIALDLSRANLPLASRGYIGFDYWANEFVGPLEGTLETHLPPSACRLVAIRPISRRPAVVSTSRHITQGVIDLTDETWDRETTTLSGQSKVVGEDPYEIRIYAANSENPWKALEATVSDTDQQAGVTIEVKQDGPQVRAVIRSTENRSVRWSIAFSRN